MSSLSQARIGNAYNSIVDQIPPISTESFDRPYLVLGGAVVGLGGMLLAAKSNRNWYSAAASEIESKHISDPDQAESEYERYLQSSGT